MLQGLEITTKINVSKFCFFYFFWKEYQFQHKNGMTKVFEIAFSTSQHPALANDFEARLQRRFRAS